MQPFPESVKSTPSHQETASQPRSFADRLKAISDKLEEIGRNLEVIAQELKLIQEKLTEIELRLKDLSNALLYVPIIIQGEYNMQIECRVTDGILNLERVYQGIEKQRDFRIYFPRFSEQLFEQIKGRKDIKTIILHQNKTTSHPMSLYPDYEILDNNGMRSDDIRILSEAFATLPNLKTLDLTSNDISVNSFIELIEHLPVNLEELKFGNVCVLESEPVQAHPKVDFSKLSNLKKLTLPSEKNIKNDIEIVWSPSLDDLSFSLNIERRDKTFLNTAKLLTLLPTLTNLQNLSLKHMTFTQDQIESLAQIIQGLPSLERLNLNDICKTEDIPQIFKVALDKNKTLSITGKSNRKR